MLLLATNVAAQEVRILVIGGAISAPLGTAMVERGFAKKVAVFPLDANGMGAVDWLPAGRGNARFVAAMDVARRQGGEFDYALWQPSEADNALTVEQYRNALIELIKMVSFKVNVKKWVVAPRAYCGARTGPSLDDANFRLVANPIYNRFVGPRISDLGGAYQGGGCRFDAQGQRKVAYAWLAAIRQAETDSEKYQKESLLYYFR